MPNDLPTIAPETLEMIARLKIEYGVTTNTEVLREALRRARPAKETTMPDSPLPAAAVEAAIEAEEHIMAALGENKFRWPKDWTVAERKKRRDCMQAALAAALPHLAAPADVAGLVARFRAGEPCHPPCKGMDARSGCICAEAADRLAALAADRDQTEAKVAEWLADNDEVFDATRRDRDALGERALKAEVERDALAERLKLEAAVANQAMSALIKARAEIVALTQASAPETGEPKQ